VEWSRDEYLDYMAGRRVDRPMFVELFGPLVGLDQEWREQGATESEVQLTAFGFDHVRRASIDVETGYWPAREEKVLQDSADDLIFRDSMGRTMRLCKGAATIALPLDFPVKGEGDWDRVKPRYQFSEERFSAGWAERARQAREKGALIVSHIVGGYSELRELMGDEEACVSYLTRPDLVSRYPSRVHSKPALGGRMIIPPVFQPFRDFDSYMALSALSMIFSSVSPSRAWVAPALTFRLISPSL